MSDSEIYLSETEIISIVQQALDEDLRYGSDITTDAIVAPSMHSRVAVVTRTPGVVCGIDCVKTALRLVSPSVDLLSFHYEVTDGTLLAQGQTIIEFSAPTHVILVAEQIIINFLSHLSAIATHTAFWVLQLSGTTTSVRDTRNTTPGLRLAEKYAVFCGGGINSRIGLAEGILITRNHVIAAGSLLAAWEAIQPLRATYPHLPVEVEVSNIEELDQMLHVQAPCIILHNFSLWDTQKATVRRDSFHRKYGFRALLEVTGQIAVDTVRGFATAGVDYVSITEMSRYAPEFTVAVNFITR